ncbi:hypothetical protein [Corynebacterium sp. H130]|uniref:hypothetical protein n=1 Tax=Corynebacterium sp. H130 TaxID=3133444 RepID=UPI0030AC9393
MKKNQVFAMFASAVVSLALAPSAHADAILPGGISSHLPENEQRQIIEDPLGAALYQSSSLSTNALHAQVGAAAFASFYSTGNLSPAWQYSGAAADAARCADAVSMSSNNSYVRFLAAMGCILPNPGLAGALNNQFRQTGHF